MQRVSRITFEKIQPHHKWVVTYYNRWGAGVSVWSAHKYRWAARLEAALAWRKGVSTAKHPAPVSEVVPR